MFRFAKIALILVIAALVIAAGRGLPVDTRNQAATAAAVPSILPGDMMRYSGPLPGIKVGSFH